MAATLDTPSLPGVSERPRPGVAVRLVPWEKAFDLSMELVRALTPGCRLLLFAGGFRRREPEVTSLPVLFIPREGPVRQNDFFAPPTDPAADCIAELVRSFVLRRCAGATKDGDGATTQTLEHTLTGLPVEFVPLRPSVWANNLVSRTATPELLTRIEHGAAQRNHRWDRFGSGFIDLADGAAVPMATEEAVFKFVGLSFRSFGQPA